MYANLTILAGFVFIYSVIAGRIEKMAISGPIVFTFFGLIMGPLGLNLLKMDVSGEGLRTLAELTLALVLFTDAAGTNMGVLEKNRQN
jgi:NhaP-type Na+/H+ or K+/H+ antiporter